MNICIPVKENNGLESVAYNHFGTAPFFLIYNTDTNDIRAIKNGDLNHTHGMCQPLKALNGENVDVILVGGIGAGALSKLTSQNIKVFKVSEGKVSDNIDLFKRNELIEFSSKNSCNHHNCSH